MTRRRFLLLSLSVFLLALGHHECYGAAESTSGSDSDNAVVAKVHPNDSDTVEQVVDDDTPVVSTFSSSSSFASPEASASTAIPVIEDNGYLHDILLSENFTTWWSPIDIYAYEALAAATEYFDGEFLSKDNAPELRKKEFAAFLAHALAESQLQMAEDGPSKAIATVDGQENKYCDRTYLSCATGKSYHGRGAFLMKGNENYARCSKALGLNTLLLVDPDQVATDPKLAWACAIWIWLKDDGQGSMQSKVLESASGGFAASTALLKGSVECGVEPLKAGGDSARVEIYTTVSTNLGIEPDTNPSCSPQVVNSGSADNGNSTDSPSTQAVMNFLPKTTFQSLFNDSVDLYSYDEFLTAVASYPDFATSGSSDRENAQELSAFLAQAAAATDRFTLRVASSVDQYTDDVFCDSSKAECLDGRSYHGRGAFMTEWNFRYAWLAEDLELDLLKVPDLLVKDTSVAWKVALHTWMVDLGNGRPHDYISQPDLLAQTSNILFGSRVCGTAARDPVGNSLRMDLYKEIGDAISVEEPVFDPEADDSRLLSCATINFDPSDNLPSLGQYFSEEDFADLFPNAKTQFSYQTLLEATIRFPKFAAESDAASNKREIAAFLAHAAVGSKNFTRLEIDNGALYTSDDFCDKNVTDCVSHKRYHGRGPFGLSWNYNYDKCGAFIDVDLLNHPEYIYIDSLILWKSTLWFWMEHHPLSPYGSVHSVMHRHLDSFEDNFRLSTEMIAGSEQCGAESEMDRIRIFNAISKLLKITEGRESVLQCQKTSTTTTSTGSKDINKNCAVGNLITEANYYDITNSGANVALYDYTAFLYATNVFSAFAGSADEDKNRREVAAFLAQVAIATSDFQNVEESDGAAECTNSPCYYGRGPLMVKGDATYAQIQKATDKDVITNPELLTTDSDIAWQSALFSWMIDRGNGSIHGFTRVSDYGFAASMKLLSPELCDSDTMSTNVTDVSDQIQARIDKYKAYCAILGVDPETVLSCQDAEFVKYYESSQVETATGSGGFASIMSKDLFQELFPMADPIYTYLAIVDAAKKFPKFANDGPDRQNRQEVAAFIAQMAHASGNFTFTQQSGWALFDPSEYCDSTSDYKCKKDQRYHGRGPIQLTWNYNYGAYGDEIGVDLLSNPDWVATDSKIAWGSALWYWMLDQQGGRGSIHDVFVRGSADGMDYDFARTTWLLNGGLECGASPVAPEPEPQRIRFFQRYAARFHVEPGKKLSCHSEAYEPQVAA